jgi:hypothetical protein
MSDNPKEDKMHDYETVRDLREKLDRGGGSQRERIATACLVGLIAWRGAAGNSDELSDAAINYADALISRLDKEDKP